MVGFYHAVDDLFFGSPYKGVLQRAHIMGNQNHNIAQNFTCKLQLGFKLDSSVGIQGPKIMVFY
jgi:hypothetical protein